MIQRGRALGEIVADIRRFFAQPAEDVLRRRPLLIPLGLAALCNLPLAALGSEYTALRWTALIVLVLLVILPIGWIAVREGIYLLRRLRDRQFLSLLLLNVFFGVLLAFAYPPLPLGWLSGVLLVPWLWTLRRTTLRDGLVITFISTWVFSGVMYFWIYHVAKVGPPVAVLSGLALLLGYLSLFRVAAAWLFIRLEKREIGWLFPLVWGGLEVFRAWGEFTFPWEHLGYTLGVDLRLIQGASWIGVYGLSVLLIASNLAALRGWEERSWKWGAVPLLLIGLLAGSGAVALSHDEQGEEYRVAVLQPNIPQHSKWERRNFYQWMENTWSLVDALRLDTLDLVVLPETAVPSFARHPRGDGSYHPQFYRFAERAEKSGTEFLVGFLDAEPLAPGEKLGNREWKIFNSAYRFSPYRFVLPERYDKIMLVPFSERLPWEGLFPMLSYVDFGEGDFSPGTSFPLWGRAGWTPNICYEVVYPDFIRKQVAAGARLLVNITNDGWFGETTAPYQHANIARFRAVELGTPMARAANTGVSLIYDGKGRILASTSIFEPALFERTIPLRSGITPYTAWGDPLEQVLLLLFGAVFFWALLTPDPGSRLSKGAIFTPSEDRKESVRS